MGVNCQFEADLQELNLTHLNNSYDKELKVNSNIKNVFLKDFELEGFQNSIHKD